MGNVEDPKPKPELDVVHDLPILEPVRKITSMELPSPIVARKRPMLSRASSMYFKEFMRNNEDHS